MRAWFSGTNKNTDIAATVAVVVIAVVAVVAAVINRKGNQKSLVLLL